MQGSLEIGLPQVALKIALTFFVFMAIVSLCGFFVIKIQRRFKQRVHREHPFTLKNLGNVASIYHLTVQSLEPLLSFQFLQNNIPLPEIVEMIEPLQSPALEQSSFEPQTNPNSGTAANKSKTVPAKISQQPPAAVKTSKKAADGVIAKTGALSGLLGIVGGLLPGSLGKSIKEKGAAVRDVQTKAKDVSEKPEEMQRKLGEVQKKSGKLGVSTPTPQNQTTAQTQSTVTNQAGINQTVPLKQGPRTVAASRSIASVHTLRYFCTNEVNPGESLVLTLGISSKKRRIPVGSSLYSVTSQQVPLGCFEKEIPPVTKQGVVNFGSIGRWHYWKAAIFSALIIAASALIIIYFVTLLWD